MKCIKPITLKNQGGMVVNCGSCHACRINYTSGWTLRLLYELGNPEWKYQASFITLTYNNENLPADYGLHKKDVQDFWKRLRKNLSSEYGYNYKIAYYQCGEYGDRTKRPHYHAIVFGLDSYNDKHREILSESWTKCDSFMFSKNKKDSGMLPVCREDIAYVTGYVQKKLSGAMAEEEYGQKTRPFSSCSHYMGLCGAYKDEVHLRNNGFTYLNGNKIAIPRYYRVKLGIEQVDLIDKPLDKERIEKENKLLFEKFEEDMKKQATWYPENLTMMAIRFERWFEDYRFAYSKQIERDFIANKKLKGRYI